MTAGSLDAPQPIAMEVRPVTPAHVSVHTEPRKRRVMSSPRRLTRPRVSPTRESRGVVSIALQCSNLRQTRCHTGLIDVWEGVTCDRAAEPNAEAGTTRYT